MRSQVGVTLIEVLITIVVLGVGLLWMAGMQSSAVRQNYLAYQFSQAANLARGLSERMLANPAGVDAGSYAIAEGASVPSPGTDCSTDICTPTDLSAWDLADWYTALSDSASGTKVPSTPKATLPDASFSVVCADAGGCTAGSPYLITIYWNPSRDPNVTKTNCDPDDNEALRCMRVLHQP
ncbi:MAG: type IV pilus modification protein PilV [Abyssibacter sp.]|nr:type IV pilus modification protein PilV [Abyssibacter sp.]MCK5859045.1 type IV pilus modification protein PilV [Abyssibacter sp.]